IVTQFQQSNKYSYNEKKSSNSKKENMNIADPLVCKHRERLSNKQIKASSEDDYSKISNSALNLSDPNLYVQPLQQSENTSVSRVPFCTINKNTSITTTQVINENSVKHKYICQLCGESGHNSRSCNKN
ncbi:9707_t:CDS:2, partial [Dentiscutata heterogama]